MEKSLKRLIIRRVKAIMTLAQKLYNKLNDAPANPAEFEAFKSDFVKLLHSEDATLKEHREKLNPIAVNIFFAFTGVGLLAIIAKASGNAIKSAINKEDITINGSLFFAKTTSQKKTEDIKDALDSELKINRM